MLGNCMRIDDDSASTKLVPIEASVQDLKNGKWCCSQAHGQPGTISNLRMSKTGKHGHTKFTFKLFYPFTGQTSQEMWPGHTHLSRPQCVKNEYMVSYADSENGNVVCMDSEENEVFAYMKADFEYKGDAIGEKFYRELDEAMDNDQEFWVSLLEGPVHDKRGDYFIRQVEKWSVKDEASN